MVILISFTEMFEPLCTSVMCAAEVSSQSSFVSLNFKAQLQDTKRRWEELQNYIHSVNTDREKIQASKQGEKTTDQTKIQKWLGFSK